MKKNGFTLVEILAVIIIIGIIMTIAIPAVSKYILSSDRAVYSSDVTAYIETVRAEYGMKEYGDLLKDDEIMIVPIEYVELEKGDLKSPFADYDLDRSYIVIVPYKNGYQYYANVVDNQKIGIVMKTQQELSKEVVEDDVKNKIESYKTYLYDRTKKFVVNDNTYTQCDIRDINTHEKNYENAIIVLCSDD